MPQHFAFVGDPGPDATAMLEALRNSGLSAKRFEPQVGLSSKLESDPPTAALFDCGVGGLEDMVEEIRENRALTSTPLLIRVAEPNPEFLRDAFRWGVDDFVVDGSTDQFYALVASLQNQDTWGKVRAPAGQVILAHSERYERVKFGRILRRNGYDTFFAGTTDEIAAAIDRMPFRAVIASSELPGRPLESVINEIHQRLEEVPPWVIVAQSDVTEKMKENVPDDVVVSFFETGEDAEGITFILNEMLAPPPPGVRRSQRILYGTPVSFVHKGGTTPMNGFSYNINMGGLYIRSLTSLPLQTEIEVRFRAPYGRGQIIVDAQVVWRKRLGETEGQASPPGMGVQFLDMWPADQAAFETGYMTLAEQTEGVPSVVATPPVPSS